jgi:hypothetical protein
MQSNFSLVAAKFWPGNANALSAFREANSLFDRTIGNQQNAAAKGLGIDAETYANAQRQVQRSESNLEAVWASLIAGAGEDAFNFNMARHPNPGEIREQTTNLLAIVTDYTDVVLSSPSPTPEDKALDFVHNAPTEDVNRVRDRLSIMFPERIFSDNQLAATVASMMRNVDIGGKSNFTVTSSTRDWYANLKPEERTALMSLIGGTAGGSNERQGSTLLGSLGRLTSTVGAFAVGTALSGGNPAVGAAAATAVSNV